MNQQNAEGPAQLELMRQVLGGDGKVLDVVSAAFDHMDTAEQEITASGCSKAQGQSAFGVLCPSDPLDGKCDDVYRAHCKELIERVVAGDDTRTGTDAEVLCCLMGASLVAPLNTDGLALADHLFTSVFPGSQLAHEGERSLEFYHGQVSEDLAEARKRCAVRDRVVAS